MQLVFRKFPPASVPSPGPGELFVLPNPAYREDQTRPLGLAALVLDHGIDALVRGPGPDLGTLVVDVAFTNPTFDDMLAATFAEHLCEGRPLPKQGCRALAEYARALRQGLRPGQVPPQRSIEGVFQAVRNARGAWGPHADLTDPEIGERFRQDWARMASCLLRAAGRGLNPLTRSPFAGSAEFTSELAFLKGDRKTYRQDVRGGQRWWLNLPHEGKPPLPAAGLLLRRPDSRLFPYWARTDRESPTGDGYLFLAVDWGDGQWVFSTDPARHVPIASLAGPLQAAESARDPEAAAQDPWYDGRRPEHNHTLVAAPRRGTELPADEVVRIVKGWAGARPVRRRLPRPAVVAAVVLALALPALAAWAFQAPADYRKPLTQLRVLRAPRHEMAARRPMVTELPDVWKKLGPDGRFEAEFPIGNNDKAYDKYRQAEVWVTVHLPADDPATAKDSDLTVSVEGGEARGTPDKSPLPGKVTFHFENVTLPSTGSAAQVTVTGKVPRTEWGAVPAAVKVTLAWRLKGDLYVLAVGVGRYTSPSLNSLTWAPRNACQLSKLFSPETPAVRRAFQNVYAHLLTNRDPKQVRATQQDITRDDICSAEASKAMARNRVTQQEITREDIINSLPFKNVNLWPVSPGPLDLVVVALNGHGSTDDRGTFYSFDPSNADPGKPASQVTAGELYQDLSTLHCNVCLILNTCYSGALAHDPGFNRKASTEEGEHAVVLFASSLSEETTEPGADWDGSPLALAIREDVLNTYPVPRWARADPPSRDPPRYGLVTLLDLKNYIDDRMEALNPGRPVEVLSDVNSSSALREIPVASWTRTRP